MAAPNWNYEIKKKFMYLISFNLIPDLAQKFKIFIQSIYCAERGTAPTLSPSQLHRWFW